jgi:LEA14-like dessication related protein
MTEQQPTTHLAALDRRRILRLGAAGAVTALMVPTYGCATLLELLGRFFKAPQLAIKSMKIKKASLSTISTRFLVNITNPNSIGFHLGGLDYALNLAGGDVAKGTAQKGITLKAKGKAQTQLDIDFDIAKTAVAVLAMIEKGAVDYALEAVGHFKVQEADIPVPARLAGRMPMPALPIIDIASFSVLSASTSGVRFRVNAAAKNKNSFDLPIDKFEFDIKLGGRSVLQNKSVKNKTLQGKKTTTVPLEFNVGLAALGLSAADLASNPRLNWEVATKVESGLVKLPFSQKGSLRIA